MMPSVPGATLRAVSGPAGAPQPQGRDHGGGTQSQHDGVSEQDCCSALRPARPIEMKKGAVARVEKDGPEGRSSEVVYAAEIGALDSASFGQKFAAEDGFEVVLFLLHRP